MPFDLRTKSASNSRTMISVVETQYIAVVMRKDTEALRNAVDFIKIQQQPISSIPQAVPVRPKTLMIDPSFIKR